MTQHLNSKYLKVTVTYISWSIEFALYLKTEGRGSSIESMQAAPNSIPTSGTFFHGDVVMKKFLRPFSLIRCFKKSSCQLLAKECALNTGKLPKRLAQE